MWTNPSEGLKPSIHVVRRNKIAQANFQSNKISFFGSDSVDKTPLEYRQQLLEFAR